MATMKERDAQKDAAEAKPESMAVESPAPATEMTEASGAIVEPEIKKAVPLDHPAVDSNPRAKTTAVQNGADFNDPIRRRPDEPDFAGQGLDPTPYGDAAKKGA